MSDVIENIERWAGRIRDRNASPDPVTWKFANEIIELCALAKCGSVATLQAKLDHARQALELITMRSHKDFRNKDTDYHNKLAMDALSELGAPIPPVTDTPIAGIPKTGEVMIPTAWWSLPEKEMTAHVLAMAKRIREQTEKASQPCVTCGNPASHIFCAKAAKDSND